MIFPGIPGFSKKVVLSKETTQPLPTPAPQPKVHADYEARVAICKACSMYRPNTDVCGMCGCGAIVTQRTKSILGKCPSKKWPGEAK